VEPIGPMAWGPRDSTRDHRPGGGGVNRGPSARRPGRRKPASRRPLDGALARVLRVTGFAYDLRADHFFAAELANGKAVDHAALQNKIGFVAQDLQQVFPALVTHSRATDLLGVNYDGMVPVLVEAIQEQQQQIEALRADVERLAGQRK
jgi:hypothetical protein